MGRQSSKSSAANSWIRRNSASISWATLDQVFSSVSNLLIVLAVARTSSTEDFGAFAISWSVFVFALALSRSALSVHISLTGGKPELVERETQHALATAILAAPAVVALVIAAPAISIGSITAATVVFALAAPFALAQDVLRHEAFARGLVARATGSDGIWFACVAVGMAMAVFLDAPAWQLVAAWGIGAVIGLLLLAMKAPRPAFAGLFAWIRASGGSRTALSSAGLIGAAAVAASAIIVGRLAGSSVVADIAGASQLMSPINTLLAVVSLWVLPRAMRRPRASRPRIILASGAAISAISLLWTIVITLLPDSIGQALLGATWATASTVVPYVGLQFSIGVFAIAAGVALSSLRAFGFAVYASVLLAAGRLANALVGSILFGTAVALSIGEAVVLLIGGALTWWLVFRSSRMPEPKQDDRAAATDLDLA